jgi:5-methylcytosine-specific restriction endonuclease McrA
MGLIADMIRAGVSPELVEQAAERMADERARGALLAAERRASGPDAYKRDVTSSEWAVLREQVFSLHGRVCFYCGSDGQPYSLACDHVLPLSRGGASVVDNLVPACKPCNSSKKDKTPQEWGRQ